MKKKILSILLIALLTLTACGKKEDAIPNNKTEGTSENSVKPDSNSNNDFKELQFVESVHATEDDNFSYTYSVIIEYVKSTSFNNKDSFTFENTNEITKFNCNCW